MFPLIRLSVWFNYKFCCSVIRIYCSTIGSTDEDVLLHEETEGNVHVNIRHSKDFNFVTVNTFSPTFSKVKALY